MDNILSIQPLTTKEKKVLDFIESFIQNNETSPSFHEIKEFFGFASINSVQNYVRQLENKKYLYKPPGNQKRALRVLQKSKAYPESLVEVTHRTRPSLPIPVLGKVAAGLPIEHIKYDETIDIPISMLKKPDLTYALQVQGNSMIEDGIHDGDTILVQRQSHADNGDIIVAVVDHEATVKRIYLPKSPSNKVELRPANSDMDSFWYDSDEVDIRGIVVGLIRQYSS